ncbi:hypothetical protein TorRG33x02_061170 [Trema orientale]|uniref:Uncharacterized protein n=1 Tax=Trema orientale TaxID=63057 RepID=A0A2P5FJU2_TREOI|nr:hypothetical protein TorRG33x02_061170 [Trema orientale]
MARNLFEYPFFCGCIVNLNKTLQDLGDQFLKANNHKEILAIASPRLASGYSYANDLLGIPKATHPSYRYAYCLRPNLNFFSRDC